MLFIAFIVTGIVAVVLLCTQDPLSNWATVGFIMLVASIMGTIFTAALGSTNFVGYETVDNQMAVSVSSAKNDSGTVFYTVITEDGEPHALSSYSDDVTITFGDKARLVTKVGHTATWAVPWTKHDTKYSLTVPGVG